MSICLNYAAFSNARANGLRRVRMAGQIVGEYNGEFFLMSSNMGARFRVNSSENLSVGEYVDVVGFPSMNSPSPVLQASLVRRTGRGPLPEPAQFSENIPLDSRLDATLVCVEARLIEVRENPDGKILELQLGVRRCLAHLNADYGAFSHLMPGSLLQLTGVYAGQQESGIAGHEINSFELLLNSQFDVKVLELPSWWTSPHIFETLSIMMLIILATSIWVAVLRRQVEQRSRQLAVEIERRMQTEHQRLLELERTRIAQDLHDDLGAQVTQISMLSSMSSSNPVFLKNAQTHLERIFSLSQELLAGLYGTVWTVNPENDNLYALGNYIRQMADHFCEPAQLRYRLQVQDLPRDILVSSQIRHNIIMAVKESLHNVIKHSKAVEVIIQVTFQDAMLTINIKDDGCGFKPDLVPNGNGLENMKKRLDAVKGSCVIRSEAGKGTLICLSMPVRPLNNFK